MIEWTTFNSESLDINPKSVCFNVLNADLIVYPVCHYSLLFSAFQSKLFIFLPSCLT